ncbi:HAMP domain-containing protein [Paenibacillus hexagrammi]|uniref:Methyl-accepting chemotaxis protein n=1 Tax=Paenibacillus hexagrammi TaxID=2908839 RepID=A0ABY3SP41_9BACL|nr:methyl-accepting chemotaxis protein [Paenibacillus sp. YPD9-1]UJF35004.1 methyl-accepting chemotaxis protein [Paenibacillus sp. YPD9-1]
MLANNRNKRSISIRAKIVIPIIIMIAFLMSATAYYLYVKVEESSNQKGLATVEAVRIGLESALTARKTAEEVMEHEMQGQAVLAAYMMDTQKLTFPLITELAKRSGIDEFWITDASGKVTLTNAGEKIDFSFGSDPNSQAYEFTELLKGKDKVISQPAQPRTVDPKVYKYVGVSGWSKSRIVQVGRDGEKLTKLEEDIGAKHFLTSMHTKMGNELLYSAILDKDGKSVFSSDEGFTLSSTLSSFIAAHAGQQEVASLSDAYGQWSARYYVTALSNGQTLLVGLSQTSLSSIFKTSLIAVIASVVITGILVYVVVYLQFARLRELEQTMVTISQGSGDLTKRLPVKSRDEIGVLAASFNQFVTTIHSIVSDVKQAAHTSFAHTLEISDASGRTSAVAKEINHAIHEIAEASAKQASGVEEGMTTIHLMADSIRDTDLQALNLEKMGSTIRTRQQTGADAVHELQSSMNKYSDIYLRASQVICIP